MGTFTWCQITSKLNISTARAKYQKCNVWQIMEIDPTRTNLLRTLICRWLHIKRTFDYVLRYCLDVDFKMKPLTLEHLKKELRAVLLSRRGGVALDQLEAEYLNLVGLLHFFRNIV